MNERSLLFNATKKDKMHITKNSPAIKHNWKNTLFSIRMSIIGNDTITTVTTGRITVDANFRSESPMYLLNSINLKISPAKNNTIRTTIAEFAS